MPRRPGWRECTVYRRPGLRGMPLALSLSEGLGLTATVYRRSPRSKLECDDDFAINVNFPCRAEPNTFIERPRVVWTQSVACEKCLGALSTHNLDYFFNDCPTVPAALVTTVNDQFPQVPWPDDLWWIGWDLPAEHHEPNRKIAIKNGSKPRFAFGYFASLLKSLRNATHVGFLLWSKRDGGNSLEGLLIYFSKGDMAKHW